MSEAEYWREAWSREPYHETGRSFEDYTTAYELGWVGCNRYGGVFDVAERVLANDWPVRKGISTLSWDEARPAVRAAWQRAENARSFISDGSASAPRVLETLKLLAESSRDGELGFREAAGHSRHAGAGRVVRTIGAIRAPTLRPIGKPRSRSAVAPWTKSGTVIGAAHRVWLQIRSLFGGASDATLLAECERGLDTLAQCYRQALQSNLPAPLHAAAQCQFEATQRHHDHIRRLRARGDADSESRAEQHA